MKIKLSSALSQFVIVASLLTSSISFSAEYNPFTPSLTQLVLSQQYSPFAMLDWKIGDKMEYDVKMGFFGKVGTMQKEVTGEQGDTVIFQQKIVMQSQNELVEVWINRYTGAVEKIIRNGKEEEIGDDGLEIIEQKDTTVTVPAGTFDALYIHAKTKQVSKIEIWMNPNETCMDGALKQVMKTSLAPVEMLLTSFHKVK